MVANPLDEPLRGVIVPLLTPLTPQGQLDTPALERLVEHVLAGGVAGLFVLGTTGEGPSLAYQTRTALISATCEIAAGRTPVLVGVTDSSMAESIDMAQMAGEAGADAVVFAPPYYFPVTQDELALAASGLAAQSPLPVFLYNMPALTKVTYELPTIERLIDDPNIIGFKDSSGDLDYFERVVRLAERRPDWSLLVGPERLLAQSIARGGHGGVNGGANLYPEVFSRLAEASHKGLASEVARLEGIVEQIDRLYQLSDNPGASVIQGLKAAMALRGLCEPALSAPLSPLDAQHTSEVCRLLEEIDSSLESSVAVGA